MHDKGENEIREIIYLGWNRMSILYPITLLHEKILVDDFFVNPISNPYILDLANTI